MNQFTYSFTVDAPLAAVVDFHQDTSVLKRLTPPPVVAQIHQFEPLAEGSRSEFTLWFGPLPVRWLAVHSQVSGQGFTDSQERGPLRRWVHQHQFLPVEGDRTQIRDHLEYEHHRGWRGLFSRLLFPRPFLWVLFTYRRLVISRALSGQGGSKGS